ncbi:hypothetical protein HKD37_16G045905 [Glycine soja]
MKWYLTPNVAFDLVFETYTKIPSFWHIETCVWTNERERERPLSNAKRNRQRVHDRDCVWCKYTWIRSAGKKVNYSSSSSLEETGCWSGFEPSHFDFSACALAITGVNIAEQFALYHGLKVAGDKGIRSLICESDSKMALQLIQHNDNAFHPHALLIRKIQSYKNWQWEVQL